MGCWLSLAARFYVGYPVWAGPMCLTDESVSNYKTNSDGHHRCSSCKSYANVTVCECVPHVYRPRCATSKSRAPQASTAQARSGCGPSCALAAGPRSQRLVSARSRCGVWGFCEDGSRDRSWHWNRRGVVRHDGIARRCVRRAAGLAGVRRLAAPLFARLHFYSVAGLDKRAKPPCGGLADPCGGFGRSLRVLGRSSAVAADAGRGGAGGGGLARSSCLR